MITRVPAKVPPHPSNFLAWVLPLISPAPLRTQPISLVYLFKNCWPRTTLPEPTRCRRHSFPTPLESHSSAKRGEWGTSASFALLKPRYFFALAILLLLTGVPSSAQSRRKIII